jgi:glutamate transport system permease protein
MGVIFDNFDRYLEGFRNTLSLTLVSAALAIAIGTVLAAFRVSPVPVLRAVGTLYVETLRNTPLTLVFFFSVFVLPQVDIRLSFFAFAVVALTVYHAAFFCEAVRSGINAVGVGQAEAARSIGLGFGQTLRIVVLPQAFRTVIPPLISVFIALTKNSSIAAAFGVAELTKIGQELSNTTGEPIAVLFGVACFYLIITIPSGQLAAVVERRVAFAR